MKFTARRGKKIMIKWFLVVAIGYVIYLFINQQVKIKIKNDEIHKINEQISVEKSKLQDIKNKIKDVVESSNKEKGKPSVRVFENVAE